MDARFWGNHSMSRVNQACKPSHAGFHYHKESGNRSRHWMPTSSSGFIIKKLASFVQPYGEEEYSLLEEEVVPALVQSLGQNK
jgi:hypothetical protein